MKKKIIFTLALLLTGIFAIFMVVSFTTKDIKVEEKVTNHLNGTELYDTTTNAVAYDEEITEYTISNAYSFAKIFSLTSEQTIGVTFTITNSINMKGITLDGPLNEFRGILKGVKGEYHLSSVIKVPFDQIGEDDAIDTTDDTITEDDANYTYDYPVISNLSYAENPVDRNYYFINSLGSGGEVRDLVFYGIKTPMHPTYIPYTNDEDNVVAESYDEGIVTATFEEGVNGGVFFIKTIRRNAALYNVSFNNICFGGECTLTDSNSVLYDSTSYGYDRAAIVETNYGLISHCKIGDMSNINPCGFLGLEYAATWAVFAMYGSCIERNDVYETTVSGLKYIGGVVAVAKEAYLTGNLVYCSNVNTLEQSYREIIEGTTTTEGSQYINRSKIIVTLPDTYFKNVKGTNDVYIGGIAGYAVASYILSNTFWGAAKMGSLLATDDDGNMERCDGSINATSGYVYVGALIGFIDNGDNSLNVINLNIFCGTMAVRYVANKCVAAGCENIMVGYGAISDNMATGNYYSKPGNEDPFADSHDHPSYYVDISISENQRVLTGAGLVNEIDCIEIDGSGDNYDYSIDSTTYIVLAKSTETETETVYNTVAIEDGKFYQPFFGGDDPQIYYSDVSNQALTLDCTKLDDTTYTALLAIGNDAVKLLGEIPGVDQAASTYYEVFSYPIVKETKTKTLAVDLSFGYAKQFYENNKAALYLALYDTAAASSESNGDVNICSNYNGYYFFGDDVDISNIEVVLGNTFTLCNVNYSVSTFDASGTLIDDSFHILAENDSEETIQVLNRIWISNFNKYKLGDSTNTTDISDPRPLDYTTLNKVEYLYSINSYYKIGTSGAETAIKDEFTDDTLTNLLDGSDTLNIIYKCNISTANNISISLYFPSTYTLYVDESDADNPIYGIEIVFYNSQNQIMKNNNKEIAIQMPRSGEEGSYYYSDNIAFASYLPAETKPEDVYLKVRATRLDGSTKEYHPLANLQTLANYSQNENLTGTLTWICANAYYSIYDDATTTSDRGLTSTDLSENSAMFGYFPINPSSGVFKYSYFKETTTSLSEPDNSNGIPFTAIIDDPGITSGYDIAWSVKAKSAEQTSDVYYDLDNNKGYFYVNYEAHSAITSNASDSGGHVSYDFVMEFKTIEKRYPIYTSWSEGLLDYYSYTGKYYSQYGETEVYNQIYGTEIFVNNQYYTTKSCNYSFYNVGNIVTYYTEDTKTPISCLVISVACYYYDNDEEKQTIDTTNNDYVPTITALNTPIYVEYELAEVGNFNFRAKNLCHTLSPQITLNYYSGNTLTTVENADLFNQATENKNVTYSFSNDTPSFADNAYTLGETTTISYFDSSSYSLYWYYPFDGGEATEESLWITTGYYGICYNLDWLKYDGLYKNFKFYKQDFSAEDYDFTFERIINGVSEEISVDSDTFVEDSPFWVMENDSFTIKVTSTNTAYKEFLKDQFVGYDEGTNEYTPLYYFSEYSTTSASKASSFLVSATALDVHWIYYSWSEAVMLQLNENSNSAYAFDQEYYDENLLKNSTTYDVVSTLTGLKIAFTDQYEEISYWDITEIPENGYNSTYDCYVLDVTYYYYDGDGNKVVITEGSQTNFIDFDIYVYIDIAVNPKNTWAKEVYHVVPEPLTCTVDSVALTELSYAVSDSTAGLANVAIKSETRESDNNLYFYYYCSYRKSYVWIIGTLNGVGIEFYSYIPLDTTQTISQHQYYTVSFTFNDETATADSDPISYKTRVEYLYGSSYVTLTNSMILPNGSHFGFEFQNVDGYERKDHKVTLIKVGEDSYENSGDVYITESTSITLTETWAVYYIYYYFNIDGTLTLNGLASTSFDSNFMASSDEDMVSKGFAFTFEDADEAIPLLAEIGDVLTFKINSDAEEEHVVVYQVTYYEYNPKTDNGIGTQLPTKPTTKDEKNYAVVLNLASKTGSSISLANGYSNLTHFNTATVNSTSVDGTVITSPNFKYTEVDTDGAVTATNSSIAVLEGTTLYFITDSDAKAFWLVRDEGNIQLPMPAANETYSYDLHLVTVNISLADGITTEDISCTVNDSNINNGEFSSWGVETKYYVGSGGLKFTFTPADDGYSVVSNSTDFVVTANEYSITDFSTSILPVFSVDLSARVFKVYYFTDLDSLGSTSLTDITNGNLASTTYQDMKEIAYKEAIPFELTKEGFVLDGYYIYNGDDEATRITDTVTMDKRNLAVYGNWKEAGTASGSVSFTNELGEAATYDSTISDLSSTVELYRMTTEGLTLMTTTDSNTIGENEYQVEITYDNGAYNYTFYFNKDLNESDIYIKLLSPISDEFIDLCTMDKLSINYELIYLKATIVKDDSASDCGDITVTGEGWYQENAVAILTIDTPSGYILSFTNNEMGKYFTISNLKTVTISPLSDAITHNGSLDISFTIKKASYNIYYYIDGELQMDKTQTYFSGDEVSLWDPLEDGLKTTGWSMELEVMPAQDCSLYTELVGGTTKDFTLHWSGTLEGGMFFISESKTDLNLAKLNEVEITGENTFTATYKEENGYLWMIDPITEEARYLEVDLNNVTDIYLVKYSIPTLEHVAVLNLGYHLAGAVVSFEITTDTGYFAYPTLDTFVQNTMIVVAGKNEDYEIPLTLEHVRYYISYYINDELIHKDDGHYYGDTDIEIWEYDYSYSGDFNFECWSLEELDSMPAYDIVIYGQEMASYVLDETPTVSKLHANETLGDATFTGGKVTSGGVTIDGTFRFKDSKTVVKKEDSLSTLFKVVFTPTNPYLISHEFEMVLEVCNPKYSEAIDDVYVISRTSTTISLHVNEKYEFYVNNGTYQEGRDILLTNLTEDTVYTITYRYKADENYCASDSVTYKVKTLSYDEMLYLNSQSTGLSFLSGVSNFFDNETVKMYLSRFQMILSMDYDAQMNGVEADYYVNHMITVFNFFIEIEEARVPVAFLDARRIQNYANSCLDEMAELAFEGNASTKDLGRYKNYILNVFVYSDDIVSSYGVTKDELVESEDNKQSVKLMSLSAPLENSALDQSSFVINKVDELLTYNYSNYSHVDLEEYKNGYIGKTVDMMQGALKGVRHSDNEMVTKTVNLCVSKVQYKTYEDYTFNREEFDAAFFKAAEAAVVANMQVIVLNNLDSLYQNKIALITEISKSTMLKNVYLGLVDEYSDFDTFYEEYKAMIEEGNDMTYNDCIDEFTDELDSKLVIPVNSTLSSVEVIILFLFVSAVVTVLAVIIIRHIVKRRMNYATGSRR